MHVIQIKMSYESMSYKTLIVIQLSYKTPQNHSGGHSTRPHTILLYPTGLRDKISVNIALKNAEGHDTMHYMCTPITHHSAPSTQHPSPITHHPAPSTLHPSPITLHYPHHPITTHTTLHYHHPPTLTYHSLHTTSLTSPASHRQPHITATRHQSHISSPTSPAPHHQPQTSII